MVIHIFADRIYDEKFSFEELNDNMTSKAIEVLLYNKL